MGAMSAANIMALSSGIQAGSSLAGGYVQSEALKAKGAYEAGMAEINAKRAEFQAEDAVKRGERDALAVKKRGKQLRGAQRAALAAQGIEVDSGSALDIQEDTAAQVAEDATMVKNNAWREAWGFKVQASDYRGQGAMSRMAARREARSTFLTGGMQALGYGMQGWGQYQKGREGKK